MWSLILYVVCVCMYVCMCIYVVFCKIDHCIHIHWCIVMGLGHNDPWVESHMWPQQTWGQRSSRGQWPLVQVFGKKGPCIHILWCIFKSNILQWMQKNVIAKAGETHGSRTALFFFFWAADVSDLSRSQLCSVKNKEPDFWMNKISNKTQTLRNLLFKVFYCVCHNIFMYILTSKFIKN